MTFKDFFQKLGDSFCSAVINAVGSTTFWMTIVAVVLTLCKIVSWETVLVTAGIYGGNRISQHVSANLGAK